METPTEQVFNLKKRGYDNTKITEEFKNKGYSNQEISDAMNQANIKSGVEENSGNSSFYSNELQPSLLDNSEIPVPSPNQGVETQAITQAPQFQQESRFNPPPVPYSRGNVEQEIEEMVEAIIDEKWEQLTTNIGNLDAWKDKVEDEITSIKQEILRVSNRLDNLQKAVLGKVSEYSQGITEVGTEVKALEKVLQNIIEPLTSNIKELSKITKELKEGKSTS